MSDAKDRLLKRDEKESGARINESFSSSSSSSSPSSSSSTSTTTSSSCANELKTNQTATTNNKSLVVASKQEAAVVEQQSQQIPVEKSEKTSRQHRHRHHHHHHHHHRHQKQSKSPKSATTGSRMDDDENSSRRFEIETLSEDQEEEEYEYEDENEFGDEAGQIIKPSTSSSSRVGTSKGTPLISRPRSILESFDESEIRPTTADMILGFRPPKNLVEATSPSPLLSPASPSTSMLSQTRNQRVTPPLQHSTTIVSPSILRNSFFTFIFLLLFFCFSRLFPNRLGLSLIFFLLLFTNKEF